MKLINLMCLQIFSGILFLVAILTYFNGSYNYVLILSLGFSFVCLTIYEIIRVIENFEVD